MRKAKQKLENSEQENVEILTMENNTSVTVDIVLGVNATQPTRGTNGSAGLDLYSAEVATIHPGRFAAVSTGMYMSIPSGYYGALVPRSGLAMRSQISIVNSPGTIDSDFRGEVKVLLENRGQDIFTVNPGDRIAQMIILPYPNVTLNVIKSLDETVRADGGFGSTGE